MKAFPLVFVSIALLGCSSDPYVRVLEYSGAAELDIPDTNPDPGATVDVHGIRIDLNEVKPGTNVVYKGERATVVIGGETVE